MEEKCVHVHVNVLDATVGQVKKDETAKCCCEVIRIDKWIVQNDEVFIVVKAKSAQTATRTVKDRKTAEQIVVQVELFSG